MIPKKLEPFRTYAFTELDRKRISENRNKLNEIIDYLSDREKCTCRCHSGSGAMYCVDCESKHDPVSLLEEASKGECNHHPNFIKDNGDCVMCVLDKPKNPPQQEESRGECDCVDGYRRYFPRLKGYKCPHKPQLKEESPKEDEWEDNFDKRFSVKTQGVNSAAIRQYFDSIKEFIRNDIIEHLKQRSKSLGLEEL